ncbi:MAG TPA: hypothetical protein VMT24_16595, partial [Aggregatilineaceae bacterium]|nr:hypothetical protein [Aggregatilineaceae bacterium]
MIASREVRSTRAGLWIVVALLIGAYGLRLWNLEQPSIWHDEGWSIRAIRDPIGTPDDNTPPVYYGLLHVLWLGAGETPLALRYGSVLLDLITVALAVRLVRGWAGWEAAILTAVFLGTSPLLWAYAREIRAYVAVPLLALVLLWQTDRLLAPRCQFPWRVWGGLLIAELALLYTHNLSVPVVGWLNLVVGAVWLGQGQWKALGLWIAGQGALLIAYIPWLAGQSPSGTPLNTPPRVGLPLVWDIWQAYFAPLPTQIGAEHALVVGSALFGALAVLSVAAVLAWTRNRRTLLLLSQAVLLPVLTTAELIVAHIDFHPRYYIASAPATLMLVALGVHKVPEHPGEIRRMVIPAAMALAAGIAAASLTALLDKPRYQHDDFRAVSEYYTTLPADAIILIPYGWEPAIQEYYADKLGIRAQILGIALHSDVNTAVETINAALASRNGPVRVELLTWYQLPADVRGMYPCLLESAGRHADGSVLTVQGITTTGYILERPVVLVQTSVPQTDYGVIELVDSAAGGQRSVCLHTEWQLQQPTSDDWRVAGRVLTTAPPGWTIAGSDTDIRADDQSPTSQWKARRRGDAFSLLRFPSGTPPGDYTMQMIIFSNREMAGLDRLVNGVPSGKLLALGIIRPAGTTDAAFQKLPPVRASVRLAAGVALAGHDAQGGTLYPGQELRITLYWQVTSDGCRESPWTQGTVTLRGDGWELAQPVAAYAAYSLDWHDFVIPAEASGTAVLAVESGGFEPVTLATYTIEKTDHLLAQPAFETPVQTEFDDLAVLEGFSVARTTVTPDDALALTLVWRAVQTPNMSYRVFTHLLDAGGRVIAQHDGLPVGEARPTTSWVPGEYLVDIHALSFVPERKDYRGPASLEVGFYDPETGERIRVTSGADHVILP